MTGAENKLRGGYYTPDEVTRFVCEWGIVSPNSKVLEPSCGDGAFIRSALNRLNALGASPEDANKQVCGVELYESEASKSREIGGTILQGDFFTFCKQRAILDGPFDTIVGNPPFIRYQDFQEEFREVAFELMRSYGFNPNRLTNIWLPFLVVCCYQLKDDGRLGMVIPAELFQVNYAAETRGFLTEFFGGITLITFKRLLFAGAQQEVVLLLAERKPKGKGGVRVIEANGESTLKDLPVARIEWIPAKNKLPESMKWQGYYLDTDTIDLLERAREMPGVKPSSNLFEVNVGLVSGQNSFFIINKERAVENGIEESCERVVSRSFQLAGLRLDESDYVSQLDQQRNVLIFLPKGQVLSDSEANYVQVGEDIGIDKNFKCRVRTPWYKVPISWKPDAFFYRQVGRYPRLVLNEAESYTTDTLHKVRFSEGVDGKQVVAAFNNSLTFLSSELIGRSYGGGVLTFEPSEARLLPIPYSGEVTLDFEKADRLAREGLIEELLDYVDEKLLVETIGLTWSEVAALRDGWHSLRNRRLSRKATRD